MVNRGIGRRITKTDLFKFVECVTLERNMKHGGTKGCAAFFGNAKVHSPECRARFQDIVDNVARAQVNQTSICKDRQWVAPPSSCGGPVLVAGRTPPEDANMEVAESSAGQPTSSVVRTLEAEDDGRDADLA